MWIKTKDDGIINLEQVADIHYYLSFNGEYVVSAKIRNSNYAIGSFNTSTKAKDFIEELFVKLENNRYWD